MQITFVGTKGEIEEESGRHKRHTSTLLHLHNGSKLLLDFGEGYSYEDFEALAPDYALITHCHPDHAFGIAYLPPAAFERCKWWVNLEAVETLVKECDFNPELALTFDLRDEFRAGPLTIKTVPVLHSTICPNVALFITVPWPQADEEFRLCYATDVLSISEADRDRYLHGCDLYIGDGSAITKSIVRRLEIRPRAGAKVPIGHASIKEQLNWCAAAGVKLAAFTHFGKEAVEMGEQRLTQKITALGAEARVAVMGAHDDMLVELRKLPGQPAFFEEAEKPPKQAIPLLILVRPHGELLARKEKTLLIKTRDFSAETLLPLYVVQDKKVWAKVVLARPEKIDRETFERLAPRHKISEAEREEWWPGKDSFFAYEFQLLETYVPPLSVEYPQGPQVFVRRYSFTDSQPKEIKAELPSTLVEIKNIAHYHPDREKRDQVLRDDWRILTAHWSKLLRKEQTPWSKEVILESAIKVAKVLIERGAIVFHPQRMDPEARDLYELVSKELGAQKVPVPHALTEEELKENRPPFDKLKDSDLLLLHDNLHHTWDDGDLNREDIWNTHKLVAEEMAQRELEHPESTSGLHKQSLAPLHESSLEPDRLVPFVLTHDALSYAGSDCYETSNGIPNDRDFIVRSHDDFLSINIKQALDSTFPEGENHVSRDPLGANWDHIPLGEFVVRPISEPVPDTKIREAPKKYSWLRDLPAFVVKEGFLGMMDATLLACGRVSPGVVLKLERIWSDSSVQVQFVEDLPPEATPVADLDFVPYEEVKLVQLDEPDFRDLMLDFWRKPFETDLAPFEEGLRQPFGSPGGKKQLAHLIVSLIPEHKTYCEPYAGGAAVFWAKEPSEVEVLNDLDPRIYHAYKFLQTFTPEQLEALKKKDWKASRTRWEEMKKSEANAKDPVNQAYHWWYLSQTSYGKGSRRATYRPSAEDEDLSIFLNRFPGLQERIKNTKLYNQEALGIMGKYDSSDSFFYLDPPYPSDWEEGFGYNKLDLPALRIALNGLKGKFLLSLDDSAENRALFENFNIRRIKLTRTFQQGGPSPTSMDSELLISNYPIRVPQEWQTNRESVHLDQSDSSELDLDFKQFKQLLEAAKQTIEPLKPFTPMKAIKAYHVAEFYDTNDLWEYWARGYIEAGRALVCEPKYDGVRITCHKKGDRVALYTEDRKRDRAEFIPSVVKEMQSLPCEEIILDAEFVLYEEGAPIPRSQMVELVVGKEPLPAEADLRVFIHDFVWLNGKNLTEEPYLERMKLLQKEVLPKPLKHLRITDYKVASNRKELDAGIAWAAKFPGSEGSMIRAADMQYDITGREPRSLDLAKFKVITELKVRVIGRLKKPLPWASLNRRPPTSPMSGQQAKDWYKKLTEKSQTYLYRGAILDGKKLVPIEAESTLTPAELNLRWAVPGKPDPLTGKMVSGERGDWRGTNDPALWEMGAGFENRKHGEIAYGVTYASNVKAKIGDIITVAPILMRSWEADGRKHFSWTFPICRNADPERTQPDMIEDAERIVAVSQKLHGKEKPQKIDESDSLAESEPSRKKCMERGCQRPPIVDLQWANGHARAWFCLSHFKDWMNEAERDVCRAWYIPEGGVPEKIGVTNGIQVKKFRDGLKQDEILARVIELAKKPTQVRESSWRLPPFGSMGGKYRLAPAICSVMPPHERYVEPFCGSAAVFFAKTPVAEEILNDADKDLIQAFRDIQDLKWSDLDDLYHRNWKPAYQTFHSLRQQKPSLKPLDHLYRFLYLSWFSYSASSRFYKYRRGTSATPNRDELIERIERARLRLARVKLTSEDGLKCIKEYDSVETLFYLDPPYPGSDPHGATWHKSYSENDFVAMVAVLKKLKGKFILSIRDSDEYRELLKDFKVLQLKVPASTPQGAVYRDGKLSRKRGELLVTNFDFDQKKLQTWRESTGFGNGTPDSRLGWTNSPTFAYFAVHSRWPPSPLHGRTGHPTRTYHSATLNRDFEVDKHLKDEWLDALNIISEIELRSSCEGHVENDLKRPSFLVFRLQQPHDEKANAVAEALHQPPESYSLAAPGAEERPRIVAATEKIYGELGWEEWWDHLAGRIEQALASAGITFARNITEAKGKIEKGEQELPPSIKAKPKTREEQRAEAEKLMGDSYLVDQPPDRVFPSTIQYHVRGIYSPDQLSDIRKELKAAGNQAELDEVFKKWKDLVWAKVPWDEIRLAAQKIDDERGDVTKAIHKFIEKGPPPFRQLSRLYPQIGNIGSVHADWRQPHPGMKYLSCSWTNDVRKSVFQTVEGDLVWFLRDRIMENQPTDQWLCQKKCPGSLDPDEEELVPWIMQQEPILEDAFGFMEAYSGRVSLETLLREERQVFFVDKPWGNLSEFERLIEAVQPMVWLTLVNPKRPELEIPVGEVGATAATAGKFIWVANLEVVYGTRKSDFYEGWFRFRSHNRSLFKSLDYGKLDGRWDVKSIPSSQNYTKAPEEQFWMAMRPWSDKGQQPYILTHDLQKEEEKAKKDKIQMIWNPDTIAALKKLDFNFEQEATRGVDEK